VVSRYFRLGVKHDGPGHVDGARACLVSIEPLPDPGFPLYHELTVMGQADGSVPPGAEPACFFDLLVDTRQTFTDGLRGIGSLVFTLKSQRAVPRRDYRVHVVVQGRSAQSGEIRLEVAVGLRASSRFGPFRANADDSGAGSCNRGCDARSRGPARLFP
jgi:hypothetical protein